MRSALFRCDANSLLGGGHLLRCLALAEGLAGRGWKCAFASPFDLAAQIPVSKALAHEWIRLDGLGDMPNGIFDLLVVDQPGLSGRPEQALRGCARATLVFEDVPGAFRACDILVDQNLGHREIDYAGLVDADTRLLLGPSYAPLRPGFAAGRSRALARRAATRGRRVLLSLGLLDADNVTGWVLDHLAKAGLPLEVDVVLGTQAPHLEAVRQMTFSPPISVAIHAGAETMEELMTNADLAIGAGGVTTWERCCLGLPSLILVLAENQKSNARELDRMGAAIDLGGPDARAAQRMIAELSHLVTNGTARLAMSRQAAKACDGGGVERVVRVVELGP